ncbi:MAG: response regulator transcription factor [Candidatus Eremiobacteraeota bacterium]|nr:response regulator transcription factor [Candidatus Eremiobacteraeota bacterium]
MEQDEEHRQIRVLLVDDHAFVRSGVKAILEFEDGIDVIGEAGSGLEAVEKAASLKPDLIIMDVNMPDLDGIEATRRIKEKHPSISVIVLTVNDEELFLIEAVRAGAASFLLKDSSSDQLINSIRAVAEGASLIPLHLLRAAMTEEVNTTTHVEGQILEPLTDKEMEVLVRITRGLRNQEIADELNLAKVTVKKRVQSILSKMMVSDRTQAAMKAVKLGVVAL